MATVRLLSGPLFNTPGLLAWATNGYKFERDRERMLDVFRDGYGLSRLEATGLLTGTIPHTIEGDVVVFDSPYRD